MKRGIEEIHARHDAYQDVASVRPGFSMCCGNVKHILPLRPSKHQAENFCVMSPLYFSLVLLELSYPLHKAQQSCLFNFILFGDKCYIFCGGQRGLRCFFSLPTQRNERKKKVEV
jgi:hypothetical protein